LLDADTAGKDHCPEKDEALQKDARAMVQGGYLHILRLAF
jgi:hypothetical protein